MEVFILVLSLLPGIAWLFFYLQEDVHPEPKRLLALVFAGGAASALFAYVLQEQLNVALVGLGVHSYSVVSLVLLAFIEEFVKFAATWLAIHRNAEFDEPVDAMIYMVVAALGFATVENLGALTRLFDDAGVLGTASLGRAFETTSLRFVGATLLHTLSSALIGYYWAKSIRTFNTERHLVFGVLAASVLHAAFNYLILAYGELSYALLFVIIIGFFVLSDFEKLREKAV